MTQAVAQKAPAGLEYPAPGVWEIDPAHSNVDFVVRHLMVSKVRGRFGSFTGTITVAERAEDSSAVVTIDAAGIDTRNETRDAHLRSPDFLDVERSPTLEFRSTRFEQAGPTTGRLYGELTIRDITRPVTLDVEYLGRTTDPWGGVRAGFEATTEIDREEFGMVWNQALETGGVVLGKKVKIELAVEAVRAS